jgi:hypothetical protein
MLAAAIVHSVVCERAAVGLHPGTWEYRARGNTHSLLKIVFGTWKYRNTDSMLNIGSVVCGGTCRVPIVSGRRPWTIDHATNRPTIGHC